MKANRQLEPKATLEQKKIVYRKIAEWTQRVDKKERERVLEMLKKRKLK